MKLFKRMLSTILVLLMIMSISAVSLNTSAAETSVVPVGDFEDYYENPNENLFYYYVFGDCDLDDVLTIKDATLIQKNLAGIVELDEYEMFLADTDGDLSVTIKDTTAIQKALAGITNGVPMHQVYSYADFIQLSIMSGGLVEIDMFDIPEGYYDLSFYTQGIPLDAILIDSERNILATGESIGAYLKSGDYKIIVSTMEDTTVSADFYAVWYAEFPLFDPDDAIELTPELQKITASVEGHVFKVPAPKKDDSMIVYTEGEAPMLYATVFDSNLNTVSYVDIVEEPYTGNQFITIYGEDDDIDFYYIYFVQGEDGTDFEICASLNSQMIESEAVELKLNKKHTCQSEYVEEYYEDKLEAYTMVADILKITPSEDGYYKISMDTKESAMMVYIISPDSSFADVLYVGNYAGNSFDVEYLEAGTTYYVIIDGYVPGKGELTVTLSTSNEKEYNETHAFDEGFDDDLDDESGIPQNCETISVGESKFVTISESEGSKFFKFTAQKSGDVVIYSENSFDAYVAVYDSSGEWIGTGDDVTVFDIYDFAIIGNVVKGRSYYFEVSSWNENDEFTVTVVNAEDYVPLN